MLLNERLVTDKHGLAIKSTRQTSAQMVVHILHGHRCTFVKNSGDRMFGVFFQAGCQFLTAGLVHVTEGLATSQGQLATSQGAGFIEHHGVDAVQGFQCVAFGRQEAEFSQTHGG